MVVHVRYDGADAWQMQSSRTAAIIWLGQKYLLDPLNYKHGTEWTLRTLTESFHSEFGSYWQTRDLQRHTHGIFKEGIEKKAMKVLRGVWRGSFPGFELYIPNWHCNINARTSLRVWSTPLLIEESYEFEINTAV